MVLIVPAERTKPNVKWPMPPRFLLFALVAVVTSVIAAQFLDTHHALLLGYDVGAIVFLISLVPLVRRCDREEMRRRAAANDAGRRVMLLLAGAVFLAVLGSLAAEIGAKGSPGALAIVLIVATLLLSWFFTNAVFAVHYAHLFYLPDEDGNDAGGIEFPQTAEPDFWDFFYFSYCLGMTFQTSDTNITSPYIRRIVTFHSMLSFVFNIGVLAFTINMLGSFGGSAGSAASIAVVR
jgi:uncharacterized membrane protein